MTQDTRTLEESRFLQALALAGQGGSHEEVLRHHRELVSSNWQPPEPEVDEATAFWQEMMAREAENNHIPALARKYRNGEFPRFPGDRAAIAYARETFARIREEAEARGAARRVPKTIVDALRVVESYKGRAMTPMTYEREILPAIATLNEGNQS